MLRGVMIPSPMTRRAMSEDLEALKARDAGRAKSRPLNASTSLAERAREVLWRGLRRACD